MLQNYFKMAWRNAIRQRGYAGINILGLAIGMASCLLILQYVSFELSFENFQVNKDRIYRVQQDRYDKGILSTRWAAGAYAAGNSFKDAIPEIEDYVKLVGRGPLLTEVGNQPLKIEKPFFASASFLKFLRFHLFQARQQPLCRSLLLQPFQKRQQKIFSALRMSLAKRSV